MTQMDWRSFGRGGSIAVGRPTQLVAVVAGVMVALLLLSTLSLSGAGAWIIRIVALVLAIPVVMLIVRRQQVLGRLAELERTGEHPDNVVHTTTPDGREIEVIVAGAEQSAMPRLGFGGLAGWVVASFVSAGLAFGLLIVVGLAQLL